jgi:hypothetical protein
MEGTGMLKTKAFSKPPVSALGQDESQLISQHQNLDICEQRKPIKPLSLSKHQPRRLALCQNLIEQPRYKLYSHVHRENTKLSLYLNAVSVDRSCRAEGSGSSLVCAAPCRPCQPWQTHPPSHPSSSMGPYNPSAMLLTRYN